MTLSQDSDGYLRRAGFAKCASCLTAGATSGQDVVHQQDPLSSERCPGSCSKGAAHIFFSLRWCLRGLLGCVANTSQPAGTTRDLQTRRQHHRQRLALVVSAIPAPPPM